MAHRRQKLVCHGVGREGDIAFALHFAGQTFGLDAPRDVPAYAPVPQKLSRYAEVRIAGDRRVTNPAGLSAICVFEVTERPASLKVFLMLLPLFA